ncbi:MAG: hypothetical protein JW889_14970 [Verrucomicrobia bacterium]|nr:hypothetical protein [Verrucomicrobiota bacterium]
MLSMRRWWAVVAAWALCCTGPALGTGVGPTGRPSPWNYEGRTPSARADGFSGPVRSVLVEEVRVAWDGNTPTEGSRVAVSRTTYDERGNRTELTEYREDGAVTYRITYAYDEEGNWKSETWRDGDGHLLWVWKYTNDKNGRWMNADLYDDNAELLESWLYTYDERGNLTRRAKFSSGGSLETATSMQYDEQDRKTEMVVGSRASTSTLSLYTYDEHGRQISISFRHGTALEAPDGARQQMTALCVDYTVIETDDNGSTEVGHYQPTGSRRDKGVVLRDEHGNITKSGRQRPGEVLKWGWTYHYEYDGHGNWTRKAAGAEPRRAEDGPVIPTDSTCRTITYYETDEAEDGQ